MCALNGEVERAQQTLLPLGEKLADDQKWEPLAAVAERSLALLQTHAAARLLVRAHEGLGKDPERIDALSRAWAIMPDDLELALLLAVRLGEAGQDDDRRALLAELAPRFAAEARWAGLEEAALEFVEHDNWDGLLALVQALPHVATRARSRRRDSSRTIVFPGVAKLGRAAAARAAAQGRRDRAGQDGRRRRSRSATRCRGAAPGPGRDAARCRGGARAGRPHRPHDAAAEAIERFDTIAALAPGRPVFHSTFGAGRIARNDGEHVFIDFAHAKGHRMPYAAARRTLAPVTEDDLRLLRPSRPPR